MGLATQQSPIIVVLKSSVTPISVKQYPMSEEAYKGIRPHIQRLLKLGILKPCSQPGTPPYSLLRNQVWEIIGQFRI